MNHWLVYQFDVNSEDFLIVAIACNAECANQIAKTLPFYRNISRPFDTRTAKVVEVSFEAMLERVAEQSNGARMTRIIKAIKEEL